MSILEAGQLSSDFQPVVQSLVALRALNAAMCFRSPSNISTSEVGIAPSLRFPGIPNERQGVVAAADCGIKALEAAWLPYLPCGSFANFIALIVMLQQNVCRPIRIFPPVGNSRFINRELLPSRASKEIFGPYSIEEVVGIYLRLTANTEEKETRTSAGHSLSQVDAMKLETRHTKLRFFCSFFAWFTNLIRYKKSRSKSCKPALPLLQLLSRLCKFM